MWLFKCKHQVVRSFCISRTHPMLIFSILYFLLHQMQTNMKVTGFEAIKSSVNSTLRLSLHCFRLKKSPLHFRPLKYQPCEMKMASGLQNYSLYFTLNGSIIVSEFYSSAYKRTPTTMAYQLRILFFLIISSLEIVCPGLV